MSPKKWLDWFRRFQDRPTPVPVYLHPSYERLRELLGKASEHGLSADEDNEFDGLLAALKLTRADAVFCVSESQRLRRIEAYLGTDPAARMKELEAEETNAKSRLDSAETEVKSAREALQTASAKRVEYCQTIGERKRIHSNPILYGPPNELDERCLLLFRQSYNR
jgi:hypothetical protein